MSHLPESRNSRRNSTLADGGQNCRVKPVSCQPSLFGRPAFCSHHVLLKQGSTVGLHDRRLGLTLLHGPDVVSSVVVTRVNTLLRVGLRMPLCFLDQKVAPSWRAHRSALCSADQDLFLQSP